MINELRHFLEIARLGTFTAAARRVHLSQPALTASIHRLESEIGATLLDRGPGGAVLTAAGRALVPWAENALSAVARGRRAVQEIESLASGEVRIGAGSTACLVLLPPLLAEFHEAHPGIHLFLREAPGPDVERAIASGDLDLGIVGEGGTEPWRDDPLVLVAAPGVNARTMPHLTFPHGANHRALLDEHFPGVPIAMELSSLAAVRAHVEAGMGVALLSRASVAREIASGTLVEVRDRRTPIVRTLALRHLGVDRLSPAARALRTLLLQG